MTVSELDRLVSKTELSPASKQMLRVVRKAVMRGEVNDPQIGSASWSVETSTVDGQQVKFRFSFRRK